MEHTYGLASVIKVCFDLWLSCKISISNFLKQEQCLLPKRNMLVADARPSLLGSREAERIPKVDFVSRCEDY